MAGRAQMAYLSRREWRQLPDAESVEGLLALLRNDPPGFIVYDRWARKYNPRLKSLAERQPPAVRAHGKCPNLARVGDFKKQLPGRYVEDAHGVLLRRPAFRAAGRRS